MIIQNLRQETRSLHERQNVLYQGYVSLLDSYEISFFFQRTVEEFLLLNSSQHIPESLSDKQSGLLKKFMRFVDNYVPN